MDPYPRATNNSSVRAHIDFARHKRFARHQRKRENISLWIYYRHDQKENDLKAYVKYESNKSRDIVLYKVYRIMSISLI